jgi:hypothetical protein
MARLGVAPVMHNERLFPAAVALLLTGLISVLDIRLFGQSWPLTWLPFAVVLLWPRQVGLWASGLLLLIGGLWLDWSSWGAPGQWPLVFLLTFLIVRPDIRQGRGLGPGMSRFAAGLLVGVPVLVLTGWIVYESLPDWGTLGRGVAVAVIALPLMIFLRDRLAGRMGMEDGT